MGDCLLLRVRSLLARKRVEQELDEELHYHLERQIEEELDRGLSPKEAHYAALRSIRDVEQRREECRDMRGVNTIENVMADFRYALRGLRRSPGFALLAVVIMALGIGANTAVFSVVNGVLLKPLAYRESDRLVTLKTAWRGGGEVNVVSLPDFRDWRDQSTAFWPWLTIAARTGPQSQARPLSMCALHASRKSFLKQWRLRLFWAGYSAQTS